MMHRHAKRCWTIAAFAAVSLVVLGIAPLVGPEFISPRTLFAGGENKELGILLDFRLPRIATAFVAGSVLSLSGMAFQAMFRNPLATPYTLGVASGASLGAAFYIQTGLAFSLLGISGLTLSGFVGAALSLSLVYGLTRLRGGFSTATLLLAGVAISFSFSSLILFVQYIAGLQHSFRIVRRLMGSLDVVGYGAVAEVLPFALLGVGVLLFYTRDLNLLSTGEDLAASRGTDVASTKKLLFFTVSLMVGGVVAAFGPIGFVGMMVPHTCRLLVGHDHRYLTPTVLLGGGTFLVACDAISRTLVAPAEMPVGVVTAVLGGPFFLLLLVSGPTRSR